MDFEAFAAAAESDVRIQAETVCRMKRSRVGSVTEECNQWLLSMGYKPMASGWHELDRQTAVEWLTADLHMSLAYDSAILPIEEAQSYATAFFHYFEDGPATYLTSAGPWHELESGGRARGSTPVSDRTFDSGYVVADNSFIGLFLRQEED